MGLSYEKILLVFCLTSLGTLVCINVYYLAIYGINTLPSKSTESTPDMFVCKLPEARISHGNDRTKPNNVKLLQSIRQKLTLPKEVTTNRARTNSKRKYKPTYICIIFRGGLGNRMFMYASAYGMARLKNMDVLVAQSDEVNKVFEINGSARVEPDTSLCKGLRRHGERQSSAFSERVLSFSNKKSIKLSGFFQSFKYFENVSDSIHSQFTFRKHIRQAVDAILLNIKKSHLRRKRNKNLKLTLIGLHARRGDMLSERNTKYGYLIADKHYFEKAMKWFRSRYRNTVFVVCSNGITWCKKTLGGHNDVYFVEGQTREVDLAVLSSCDHMIMSVGTFSWWAAWLCKGTVIYYFPPAREGSKRRMKHSRNYSDYFPSKWIHF